MFSCKLIPFHENEDERGRTCLFDWLKQAQKSEKERTQYKQNIRHRVRSHVITGELEIGKKGREGPPKSDFWEWVIILWFLECFIVSLVNRPLVCHFTFYYLTTIMIISCGIKFLPVDHRRRIKDYYSIHNMVGHKDLHQLIYTPSANNIIIFNYLHYDWVKFGLNCRRINTYTRYNTRPSTSLRR